MKAYIATVLVIDHERIGKNEIDYLLEDNKYIIPHVMDIKEYDIGEWSDEHPLNNKNNMKRFVEKHK